MVRRHRLPLVIAAAWIVSLMGCQQSNKLAGRPAFPRGEATQDSPQMSSSQTADVEVALGRMQEKNGELPAAIQAYSAALKHDPKRAEACWRLAVVSGQQEDFATATAYFEKALALQPGNPDIVCDMGYCLYVQERWREAEMNFRQATALNPDHARAHNNLGLLLARTDRQDEALAQFTKSGCSPAEAHENVSFGLALEHRWDEAQIHCEQALALNPSSNTAQSLRTTLAGQSRNAVHDPGFSGHDFSGRVVPAKYGDEDSASQGSSLHESPLQLPFSAANGNR